jgi:hypothetical protein
VQITSSSCADALEELDEGLQAVELDNEARRQMDENGPELRFETEDAAEDDRDVDFRSGQRFAMGDEAAGLCRENEIVRGLGEPALNRAPGEPSALA